MQTRADVTKQATRLLEKYKECLGRMGMDESKSAEELSFNFILTP
jgi:hypothetical protein